MTARRIVEDAARRWGISVYALRSRGRWGDLVAARWFAALRMRTELRMSYPEIGQALGGRHHTTIMHLLGALRRVR